MDSFAESCTTLSPTSDGYSSNDENSDSLQNESISVDARNYLTIQEGFQDVFTLEQLTDAITVCQDQVLKSEKCSEERKWLVRRLIELKHRLAQVRESDDKKPLFDTEETLVRLGHNFIVKHQPASAPKQYCDKCCGTIWNVIQNYYNCVDCNFKCHIKCYDCINRICPLLTLAENPAYEKKICPEVGLDKQRYACFECNTVLSFRFARSYRNYETIAYDRGQEARRCDYTGRYFCPSCHWNTMSVIPARITNNWDFDPQPVSRAAYQLLRMSRNRPMIFLDDKLYSLVDELGKIKKMREEIPLMKQYLVTCRFAKESGFVKRELEWKKHLVHSTDVYSLNDLLEIHSGSFLTKMENIYSSFINHIKKECEICKGRGFFCEFCTIKSKLEDAVAIYAFESSASCCPKCGLVQHKVCWKKQPQCPRCLRKSAYSENE